jgi:hypothetical protein
MVLMVSGDVGFGGNGVDGFSVLRGVLVLISGGAWC